MTRAVSLLPEPDCRTRSRNVSAILLLRGLPALFCAWAGGVAGKRVASGRKRETIVSTDRGRDLRIKFKTPKNESGRLARVVNRRKPETRPVPCGRRKQDSCQQLSKA